MYFLNYKPIDTIRRLIARHFHTILHKSAPQPRSGPQVNQQAHLHHSASPSTNLNPTTISPILVKLLIKLIPRPPCTLPAPYPGQIAGALILRIFRLTTPTITTAAARAQPTAAYSSVPTAAGTANVAAVLHAAAIGTGDPTAATGTAAVSGAGVDVVGLQGWVDGTVGIGLGGKDALVDVFAAAGLCAGE